MSGFVVSTKARKSGVFTYRRGKHKMTIQHRAIVASVDLQIAADRAFRTAHTIREGLENARSIGFQLPDDFGSGWTFDDWQSFGSTLVQAELLALVATSWDGVTDEAKEPFPLTVDAVRAMMLCDPAMYQAWSAYSAKATAEASEGNVFALSQIGFSAGARLTAQDALN
ncbi:hypothetical protein sos41_11890 [Alphaproteobacteria bacterium SO-S41]|nr:hypothetical protein sos41_11890 [Alphaproteobacteria bacterium SO-S41]